MDDMSNISWLTELYLLNQGASRPHGRQEAIDAMSATSCAASVA